MAKVLSGIAVIVCIAAVVFIGLFHFGILGGPGKVEINVSSLLMDSIDIAELSTAEFRYRGIAEVYKDEKRESVSCRVCYDAVVKAGIDTDEIHLEVNEENKTVTAVLPEIELKVTIKDEESMALLPSNANVELKDMIKYSKEDAEREARASGELIDTARKNLEDTIEGLMYPILKAQGYTLVWN